MGPEGLCPSQELLILQMMALEQNRHLQILDMELSNQEHGITLDKWKCQPWSLGKEETQHFFPFL